MKNIKYLALLLFSITLLISCGQDEVDSVTNPGVFSPTSEVNIGFTDANLDLIVLENDTDPAAAPITFIGFILAFFLKEKPLQGSADHSAARAEATGEAVG